MCSKQELIEVDSVDDAGWHRLDCATCFTLHCLFVKFYCEHIMDKHWAKAKTEHINMYKPAILITQFTKNKIRYLYIFFTFDRFLKKIDCIF